MTKVLGVDVGAVRDKVGGRGRRSGDEDGSRPGDPSGGLGSAVGAVGDLGAFLREQRESAQLSLRQLAAAAGVSNPYLSQVERGLRRPSAEVLGQIARGLRISAEALYVRAGILEERPGADGEVREAVMSDPFLSERQRQVVLEIYSTFRAENARSEVPVPTAGTGAGTAGEEDPSTEGAPASAPPASAPPGADAAGRDGAKAPAPRRRRRTSSAATSEDGDDDGSRRAPSTRRTGGRTRSRTTGGDEPPSPLDVAQDGSLTVPAEPSAQESAASHPVDSSDPTT